MPEITGLGHVGLFCHDLRTMRDFYARVLGLTISDEDLERGICFLSAAPEAEHHELALVQAKEPAQKTHNVQQVSFKVKTLDDVRGYYHRLLDAGVKIDRTVTHGIACSVLRPREQPDRAVLHDAVQGSPAARRAHRPGHTGRRSARVRPVVRGDEGAAARRSAAARVSAIWSRGSHRRACRRSRRRPGSRSRRRDARSW